MDRPGGRRPPGFIDQTEIGSNTTPAVPGPVVAEGGLTSGSATGQKFRMATDRHRPVPAGKDGSRRPDTRRRCLAGNAVAASALRPGRLAANTRTVGRVRSRPLFGRLRQDRRRTARIAPFRRTLGPALAGRGPFRRIGRQQPGRADALGVEIPQLRDRRGQRRHPLRPVPGRTACR